MLLGYSLEPRPNSHALGTVGSVMTIGLSINRCSHSKNQFIIIIIIIIIIIFIEGAQLAKAVFSGALISLTRGSKIDWSRSLAAATSKV